jgi:hypothetical protein
MNGRMLGPPHRASPITSKPWCSNGCHKPKEALDGSVARLM